MKITLDITSQDFDYLTSMQMRWAGTDWEQKEGRFELFDGSLHISGDQISYGWSFVHWVATYADYILVRAYLQSMPAHAYQAVFDGATDDIAILTDYAGSWSD